MGKTKKRIFYFILSNILALLFFSSCQIREKTIVISIPSLPLSFDPHIYNHTQTLDINQHIYDSLFFLDDKMRIIPNLVEKWENIDHYTWVFTLKKNIHFSNGDPLTSDDVIFSFTRNSTPEFMPNGVKTLGVRLNFTNIKKIDNYTVEIQTEYPTPIFLLILRNFSILPSKYIKGNNPDILKTKPIGSGPYVLESYDKNEIVLKRNTRYWKNSPYYGTVIFKIISSPAKAYNALINNEINFISDIDSEHYQLLSNNKKFKLRSVTGFRTYFLMFDLGGESEFHEYNIRKAVSLILNLKKIIPLSIGIKGYTANQFVSPYVLGYNPSIKQEEYNPELALKYMKESKYPHGFNIDLNYSEIVPETLISMIKEQLGMINIHIQPKFLPQDELLKKKGKKEISFYIYSLNSGTGDSAFFITSMLHSRKDFYGRYNSYEYSNEELDKMIEKVDLIFNEKTRLLTLQQIMQLAIQDIPFIPLYYDINLYAYDKNIDWIPRSDDRVYAFLMQEK